MSLIGQQLANYKVERLLGRGGMADVYYATDIKLQRPVALKVVNNLHRDNMSYVERFLREARVVASWRHPNIVQIYYADEFKGIPFYAMEYIEGQDLSTVLQIQGGRNMPHEEVLRIGYAVADALDYAHSHGVIHRDIKPSNIMLANDRRIILTDFGLALEVSQGSIGETFGSAHYISPEQAHRSSDAIPQSDIYSLGVIMYEVLTGSVPFDGDSLASVAIQVVSEPPPPPRQINPELSSTTEAVLLRVLSKNVEERFQTATAFMTALQQSLGTRPSSPMPPSRTIPSPAAEASGGRSRFWLGIAGLVVLLLSLGGLALASGIFSGDDEETADPTSDPGVAAVVSPSDIPAAETEAATEAPTAAPATEEPSLPPPTATTVPPTATLAEATQQPTDPPAPTDAPPPTVEPSPVPAATDVPAVTVATEVYPDGRVFRFIYEFNTFVVWNSSDRPLQITRLEFEGIDADGAIVQTTSGNLVRLDGAQWARFYDLLEPRKCVALEITQQTPYVPDECDSYNARLTPSRESSRVFWLPRTDNALAMFRVLYDGDEVARCPLWEQGVEICEVKLP